MGGEVPEVLGVQGRQRQLVDKAARGDPRVIHRPGAPALLGSGLQLAPCDRDRLVILQDSSVLPPLGQLSEAARSPAAQRCPLGQFAKCDKADAQGLAS